MFFLAVAFSAFLVMGAYHIEPVDEAFGPGYTMVATHGAYGIIIDAEFAGRFVILDEGERFDTWTPTAADVAQAEELIAEIRGVERISSKDRAEASSPEDLVSRTWFGLIIDGERLMLVNGYCWGGLPEAPLYPVWVMDGGSCYWNATINAETWEVVSYQENGDA